MKRLFVFIKKEFAHVLRDKRTLLILFAMPIIQVIIFGFVLTNEVKDSKIVIIDYAKDAASRDIVSRIEASQYFKIQQASFNEKDIESSFKKGDSKVAILFPADFEKDLMAKKQAQVQIISDASDPNYATTVENYLSAIIKSYTQARNSQIPYQINTEVRMLYNPQLKGAPNFVPGVMAMVLMLICVLMTAISIVKEKETGTMEVLLVSPFSPFMVIISKSIPYFVLSLINVIVILLLSVFLLDVPIKGNILLLMAESAMFIITCLSLGIFISIQTDSQQTAMLISLMGMMLPTMLFSGFMFPIENMPVALQWLSNIVPSKWFYRIIKGIMIKGVGLDMIWKETLILLGMTLFFLLLSLKRFKIRLE